MFGSKNVDLVALSIFKSARVLNRYKLVSAFCQYVYEYRFI